MSPRRELQGALVVLALAAVGRLLGIDWALPGELHRYSYHPDEWQVVETALRIVLTGDANPHFFNYPSAQIYLTALVLALTGAAGGSLGSAYLTARLLTVALSLLAVVATWRLGRRLGGPAVGLGAAALLAVLPLAVVNAHFATVDAALACWVALTLWAAVVVAQAPPDQQPWRPLLAGAVTAGLAAGTKYNGLLVLLPLLLALSQQTGWRAARLAAPSLAASAVTLLTFVATSPFVWIDPLAAGQIRFELLVHPRETNLYQGVGPGWWFHLKENLPTGTGWLFTALSLLAVPAVARQRAAWPLLLWLALAGGSLLGTRELFLRYWLPLLPALCVTVALLPAAVAPPRRQRVVLALLLLAAAESALAARAYAALLARPDARDQAATWCRQQIPVGETVAIDGGPWFWSVPLHPNNGGARTMAAQASGRWPLQPDLARAAEAGWLVVNRTHLAESGGFAPPPGFTLVAEFCNQAVLLPGWVVGGPGSRRHDWNYILPDIAVYRR
ncbi:MAG: glycosyltransferase family 39 protein [Fimbriimonadaceae bacterium]|nr:glycosyltransferase family 39 protein [Fimbriimonadaceae bacterium]